LAGIELIGRIKLLKTNFNTYIVWENVNWSWKIYHEAQ